MNFYWFYKKCLKIHGRIQKFAKERGAGPSRSLLFSLVSANGSGIPRCVQGERLTDIPGERSYLFQRLSVIVQRFNSVLIHESFVSADEEPDL